MWEQTATCATYSINWLVFITEMKSVYSAVRPGVFKESGLRSVFKGLIDQIMYPVWNWCQRKWSWHILRYPNACMKEARKNCENFFLRTGSESVTSWFQCCSAVSTKHVVKLLTPAAQYDRSKSKPLNRDLHKVWNSQCVPWMAHQGLVLRPFPRYITYTLSFFDLTPFGCYICIYFSMCSYGNITFDLRPLLFTPTFIYAPFYLRPLLFTPPFIYAHFYLHPLLSRTQLGRKTRPWCDVLWNVTTCMLVDYYRLS